MVGETTIKKTYSFRLEAHNVMGNSRVSPGKVRSCYKMLYWVEGDMGTHNRTQARSDLQTKKGKHGMTFKSPWGDHTVVGPGSMGKN